MFGVEVMIDNFTKFSAIVHYKQFGGTLRHVARKYGVSKSSLARWVNANPACDKTKCLRRDRKTAVQALSKFVVDSMEAAPFLTAKDLVARVSQHWALQFQNQPYRAAEKQTITGSNGRNALKTYKEWIAIIHS